MRHLTLLRILAMGLLLGRTVSYGAVAQDGDARAALKSMTDYLTSRSSFAFNYDSILEVVITDLQKIQFTSSGHATVARPNRFRIERIGGFTDAELISDGSTLYLHGKKAALFAQAPAPASLDELFTRLEDLGINVPLADILTSDAYDGLVEPATDANVVGPAIVNGKECQLLRFRTRRSTGRSGSARAISRYRAATWLPASTWLKPPVRNPVQRMADRGGRPGRHIQLCARRRKGNRPGDAVRAR
jgi:hypothetical protein